MSDSEEINRRLERLETRDEKMEATLQQLVISTNRLIDLAQDQKDIIPKVHKLEIEVEKNKQVITAVKWLGVTIAGFAIVQALTFLFG